MAQPVQFSSNSSEHCAFLSCRSCFLQLLWWVLFILHSLCLSFHSLTTMLLVSRPLASPILSCFLQYFSLGLVNCLSLLTRLSYYCYSRLSILFLKIFLFTRLRKPANPHKYRLFGMKKSFFVKNYFLLKRKIKVVGIRQSAYKV